MIIKQLDNRNRFDVYDRHPDTEGKCIVVTEAGTVITINEDCFKGIDVLVEWAGKREVISWSDQYPTMPARRYTFDAEPVDA